MKNSLKLFSRILLVILLFSLILTGCNNKNKDENTLWIGVAEQGYGIKWLEDSIRDFNNKYPQYKVIINEKSAEFSNIAETRLQTGTTVNDLIICASIRWQPFAREDKLVDLSDVYAQPIYNDNEDNIESGMLDGIKSLSRAKGKDGNYSYYIMKIEDGISSFVYNKTVINFYESKAEWGSKKRLKDVITVDELMVWAQNLQQISKDINFEYKDGSGSGPVAAFTYPGQYLRYWDGIVTTWWAQYSGFEKYSKFFEMEDATVYSDEGRLKALEAFEKLNLSVNALSGSSGYDHISSQNAFISGKAALIPNGMWIENESKNAISNWGTEIGMISVPYIDAQHKNNYLFCASGSQALIPNRKDTNINLAKKFLAFLNTEEQIVNYTRTTGGARPFYLNYADKLIQNLEISDFTAGCLNLRKNADKLLNDIPKNIETANYLLISNGDTDKWCLGLPYGALINKEKTARKIYDDEINRAVSKWDEWLLINNLK